jgi:hypothetical protein
MKPAIGPVMKACELCREMNQKPLHFVQRGRILLRCGSALALSLPSLGVSSLDLGRLPTQAALFSWRGHFLFLARSSSCASFRMVRTTRPQTCNCASRLATSSRPGMKKGLFRSRLKWSELVERNGGQGFGQHGEIGGHLSKSCAAFTPPLIHVDRPVEFELDRVQP